MLGIPASALKKFRCSGSVWCTKLWSASNLGEETRIALRSSLECAMISSSLTASGSPDNAASTGILHMFVALQRTDVRQCAFLGHPG